MVSPGASSAAFTARLRDLLATLESSVLLGVGEARVRGLGEHLRFACLALPCDEALVALEVEALGRLRVPVVASAEGARAVDHDLVARGTPFSYLLGGGTAYAAELAPSDAIAHALAPVLARPPRAGIFAPIRLGGAVVGGAALLSHAGALGDRELVMAERLAEVLALTVESFRTERVLFELFARALPDLLGPDARTRLDAALARHLHAMRLAPEYRRRLALADAVGRLASRGDDEAALAGELVAAVERYAARLEGGPAGGAGGEPR
jgi:GAF domain-containing protein